ncbi:methylated-DNA--[protein]-cysteine S-methyltransferase [Streptomyces sp. 3MP-14]|uniref:Methylated-DNA--protein-cysteine methyltransferase n=1 Tax=Streptomyces mimosae TaxID=2586635 RepID=A0A5N6AJD3_9ACTN|nr:MULTISPECIES: methylated-DNA--[protein]-cysteine S-methyltransferase [Streptomyces]KAB8168774.1 methylated-DNA--[protein]-cysteine S-methyltransferase [Streptomyces mimosae]KAB8177946.1 methylated-DNA--[protein]-cysteine S-methyltransferase [Streptomyces sp. 3MP-14]
MSEGKDCVWSVERTPIGPLLLAATGLGLVRVVFHADERRVPGTLSALARGLGVRPAPAAGHPMLTEAAGQLAAYFAGRLRAFELALDWSLASGFTERVLRELATGVPLGTVVSYQDLARRVGEPGAAQAVGAAMGANPLPVVVPCHRVVTSDGGIGGFGGGLETKRQLLALEGVLPSPLF